MQKERFNTKKATKNEAFPFKFKNDLIQNVIIFIHFYPSWFFSSFSQISFIHIQVWDVVSNEKAVEIVSSASEKDESSRRLVDYASNQWKRQRPGFCTDDISAVCLFFHNSSSSQQKESD